MSENSCQTHALRTGCCDEGTQDDTESIPARTAAVNWTGFQRQRQPPDPGLGPAGGGAGGGACPPEGQLHGSYSWLSDLEAWVFATASPTDSENNPTSNLKEMLFCFHWPGLGPASGPGQRRLSWPWAIGRRKQQVLQSAFPAPVCSLEEKRSPTS